MHKLVTLLRKAGWNLGDQILSALSNVLLTIVVARSVSASDFGAFSIAFLVYGIGVAVTRSLVGQPLQMRYSGATDEVRRPAVRRGLGAAVAVGVVGGLGCAAAGLALGGAVGTALLALALCLPSLLLQDSQRLTFFAAGEPVGAVVIDAVWTVAQFGVLWALISTGHASVGFLVLGWGGAATLSALVGVALLRSVPRPFAALAWLREIRSLVGYLLAEYILGLGASQVGVLLVGVIASPSAVGALRAAQTLLGPLNILGTAAFNFTVPEVARRPDLTPARRRTVGHVVSGLMGTVTLAYVGVLLLMPDPVGTALFHESWLGAATVLLPLGVGSVFSGLANGIAGVLYGMGRADATFRLYCWKAPVIVVAVVGGTYVGGALGAACGMAFAEAFVLPLWYVAFRRAVVGAPRSDEPEPTPAPESADPLT